MHRRRTTFQHVTRRWQRNDRRGGTAGVQSSSRDFVVVVHSACPFGSAAGNDHLLGLESCPPRSVSIIPADAIMLVVTAVIAQRPGGSLKPISALWSARPSIHDRASKCDNSPCTLLFATASASLCSCCPACCISLLLCPCRLGSHPPEGRHTLATALLRESTRGPQSCVSRAVGSLACHAPRLERRFIPQPKPSGAGLSPRNFRPQPKPVRRSSHPH